MLPRSCDLQQHHTSITWNPCWNLYFSISFKRPSLAIYLTRIYWRGTPISVVRSRDPRPSIGSRESGSWENTENSFVPSRDYVRNKVKASSYSRPHFRRSADNNCTKEFASEEILRRLIQHQKPHRAIIRTIKVPHTNTPLHRDSQFHLTQPQKIMEPTPKARGPDSMQ